MAAHMGDEEVSHGRITLRIVGHNHIEMMPTTRFVKADVDMNHVFVVLQDRSGPIKKRYGPQSSPLMLRGLGTPAMMDRGGRLGFVSVL